MWEYMGRAGMWERGDVGSQLREQCGPCEKLLNPTGRHEMLKNSWGRSKLEKNLYKHKKLESLCDIQVIG